jgi:2-polyprenyl-3-methyl-5-hydroxy-6-metoxy-1,4-benzoquinol methylase
MGVISSPDMYNEIAALYHLIYRDWNAVIAQPAAALDAIIREHVGPSPRSILDVSCGSGTQALGLAALGHAVTASDLSSAAVERARLEGGSRIKVRRRAQCRQLHPAFAQ